MVRPAGERYVGVCFSGRGCARGLGAGNGECGVEQAGRRFGGGPVTLVRAVVVALVAVGCDDDTDRRARQEVSRALVQTLTIPV